MNASFDFPSLLDDLAGPIGLKLALALLHFLWQGVLIAAVAAVLTRLVGRRSSQRRYLIGVAGMALMAVAPIATFCFVTPPEPPPVEPVPIVDASELLVDLEQFDAFLTTLDVPPVEAPAVAPPAVRLSWPERLRLIQPYAVLLWLAGSLLCGLRLVIGAHSSLKCRRGRRAVPEAWLDIVAKAAGRIGIKSPSVFVSDRVAEAIAVGLLRPMVLLPAAWIGRIPPDVLEAVLAHELSHLRRYDLWVNLFQRIVESVLFYHPAVWWLSRRVRLEREYCCDETAAEAVAGRAAYARALEYVATERVAGGRTELFQAALAAGMRGEDSMALLNRVHRVLGNDNRPRRTPRLSEGLLALAVPVALWAGIATVGPALAQENDTQDSADTASHETEVEAVEDKQPAVSDELLAFNFGHGGPDGSWRLLAHPDTGIGATYRKLSVSPQSLEHSLTEEERSRLAEKLRRDIDRRDESLPPLENFIRALHGREPAFETRADDESQKLSPTFQVAFRGPSGEFIVRLFRQNGRLDFYRRDDTALASLGDRSRRVIAAMLDQKARKRPEAVPTNIDEIIAYLGGAPIAYTDESDGHREKSDALRELREELKSLRSEVEELRSGRVEPRTSLPIVHKSKEDLWQDYMSAIKARDEAYGRILRLEKSQAEDPAYERFAQERYREAENRMAELYQRVEQVDPRLFERFEGKSKFRVVTDLVKSEDGKTRQFKRLVPVDAKPDEPSDDRRSPDADGFQPLVDPAAKPHTVYELEVIPNSDGKSRYVPRTRIRNTPPPHMEESLSGPPVIVQRVVKLHIDGKEVPVVVEETRDTPNGQAKEIHLRLLKKAKDGTPVYPNPQPENDEKPDDAAQKEASAEIKQLVEEYRQAVKSRDEAARLAASEAQSGRNLAHSQNRLVEAQRELERVQAELERRKILAGLTVGELNAPGDDEPKEASAEVKQLVEEYRQAVKSRDEAARLAAAEAAKGVAPSQKWLVEAQRKLEQIQAELERRKILVGLPVDDAAPAEQMPSDEAAYLRVYPVGDFIASGPDVKKPVTGMLDTLVNLISRSIRPSSWEEAGGKGRIQKDEKELKLLITQTKDGHEEIADLLKTLKALQGERSGDDEPAEADVTKALEKPVSLHFEKTPLEHVLATLRNIAGVNFVIDKAGLDEEGVTLETPVSINVDDMAIRNVLSTILSPLNLTATTDDGVVVITSRQRAKGPLVIETYPVGDLVLPRPQPNKLLGGRPTVELTPEVKTQSAIRFKTLIDLITGTVEPSSWEIVGGQGVLRQNDTTLSLVIRQTRDVHEEIHELLEQLRKMRRSDADAVLGPDKINRKHKTPATPSESADDDEPAKTTSVKVRVEQAGTYYVDGYAASATGLASAIKEAMADGDRTELVIQADRAAPFSAVARIIEAAKEIGVDKIRFATEPAASPNEDLSGETSDNEAKQDGKTATEWDKLVSEYNELIDQRNFAEALTIAKKVRELDPENLTGVTMLYKAKVLLEETRQPSPDRHISTEALLDSTSAIEPVPGATDGMSNRADGPSSHDTGGRSPVPAVAYGPIVYGSKNLPRKLLEVRVEGNRTVPTKSILEDVEMSPGQQLSSDRIAEDTRRLLRTRRFLSVTPRITSTDGGAIVTFEVVERPYDRADSAMPDDEDETTNGASLDRSFRGVGQLFQLATQDLLLHEELQPVAGEVVQIVSTASGDDQILITPGSNAGLRKGATVEVFHDNDYVAKLELTSVEEALSLGRVIRRAKNMEIRQGDRVSIGP